MRTPRYTNKEFVGFMNEYRGKHGVYPSSKTLEKKFRLTAMSVHNYWHRLSEEGEFDLEEMRDNLEKNIAPTHRYVDRTEPILEYINDYYDKNGISPSVSEIASHIGVSNPIIYKNLNRLEQAGAITRQERIPRSIRVL